ncbi:unnamed protein product [Ectocarpus sp. CCAP 1310/34]|nr:unnamed protein product [Ectocarpus sp. CCAP 1310/34]
MEFSTEQAEEEVGEIEDEMRRGKRGTKDFQRRAVISNLLTLVEFVLSLVNAVKRDGFQFATLTEFVFVTSAAMKFVGLLFALVLAVGAYMAGRYRFGNGGSPLAMVWMAKRKNDDFLMRTAVITGFGAQALAVWASAVAYNFASDAGIPAGGGMFLASVFFLRMIIYACHRHGQLLPRPTSDPSATTDECSILALGHLIVLLVALIAPLAIEAIESVLLFSMTESPEDIVLAIIDVGLSFGAIPFVCSFLGNELPEMWKSVTSYHSQER